MSETTTVLDAESTVGTKTLDSEWSPGDHDRFSHLVKSRNPLRDIEAAVLSGTKMTAICGKRWVPSSNPKRFPLCPDCKRIKADNDYMAIMGGGQEGVIVNA